MKFSLGSDKRLKSQKKIDRLFTEGKRIQKFPLRAVFFAEESETPKIQIAVSVPKKLVKKANNRNLIKRRMREAFRLNQYQLNTSQNLDIMFIYSTSEIMDYAKIEKSMKVLIDSLNSLSNDNISEI
ncbi:ribonuclease P protein component [Moheibacter stercoris]|uniref:Ribonuclease P protein component n=1 Tax=Moheibacter stercoris TaxID=1628251 RepID=A0ABV2LQ83_9FLAO